MNVQRNSIEYSNTYEFLLRFRVWTLLRKMITIIFEERTDSWVNSTGFVLTWHFGPFGLRSLHENNIWVSCFSLLVNFILRKCINLQTQLKNMKMYRIEKEKNVAIKKNNDRLNQNTQRLKLNDFIYWFFFLLFSLFWICW